MAANLDALVIDKAKANALFNTAVQLEAQQKAAGVKNFDDVYRLYEKALELDPSHKRAEQHFSRLDIYRWGLYLNSLLAHARALQVEANGYEMGKYNNGVPNPEVAMAKYQEARAVYDKLINKLNSERNGERSGDGHYKANVIAMYEIVSRERLLFLDKEKANALFNTAVRLEAQQKAAGVKKFDDVYRLYEEALELDPSHKSAALHRAMLDIYCWGLHLNSLLAHARALQVEANDYEMGKYNNGVPNPGVAIAKYQEATAVYDKLINKLNAERNGERSGDGHYKANVIAMYEIVLQEKSLLPNRITGNVHYQWGLDYEATVGKEGATSYQDFITLCKKAEEEYKKAETLNHIGARSCLARLLYHIEGQKSTGIELYKKASSAGDAAAMNELGILYEKGEVNREIELDEAMRYYEAASVLNYIYAIRNRDSLREKKQDTDKNKENRADHGTKLASLEKIPNRIGAMPLKASVRPLQSIANRVQRDGSLQLFLPSGSKRKPSANSVSPEKEGPLKQHPIFSTFPSLLRSRPAKKQKIEERSEASSKGIGIAKNGTGS